MRRLTARSTFLFRAALATALFGHWLANTLFDRGQYADAGSELMGHLDDPMLIQAALAAVALVFLTMLDRHRGAGTHAPDHMRPGAVGALLIFQLLLFIAMEATERLAIDALAREQADVGVFGVGFVAELLVAIGSALLLALAGEVTRRSLGQLRQRHEESRSHRAVGFAAGHRPATGIIAGGGGVRAPPSRIESI